MKRCPKCHVKKRTLLAIAGSVWMVAGANVARMGVHAYAGLSYISVIHGLLSLVVLGAFGTMFYQMSLKHAKRIRLYEGDTRPFWHFFDVKAYLIMAFMMSGGIWFRSSRFASVEFIAVFYTGLGAALALAGVFFWCMYAKYPKKQSQR